MNRSPFAACVAAALAVSSAALAADAPKKPLTFGASPQLSRGQYLVGIMGCDDCHTPMKMGEWLTMRGQNMTDRRAVAARALAERLNRERISRGGSANETLGATRYLTQLPSATEVRARAEAAATAHVDSTQKFGSGPRAQKQRNNAIMDAADSIFLRMMQEQDSLRTAPLARLRSAAVDDSTAAAQPIQLPKDFTDLFQ